MEYTPPKGNNLLFELEEYTTPKANELLFDLQAMIMVWVKLDGTFIEKPRYVKIDGTFENK